MPHFFVSAKDIKGNEVLITGGEARHITTVLRKREGDRIDVFDGSGREFKARILEIDRHRGLPRVKAEIITEERRETEPKLRITLFQAIPKGNRLEFIIQKSTEIGVSEIVPITTERTIVRLDHRKIKQKTLRWQKIAREAAKQSRRNAIPRVGPVLDFSRALQEFSARKPHTGIIAWEMEEKNRLREALRNIVGRGTTKLPLAIFIGPEGGFTAEEVEEARKRGLVPVTLGSGILRTETAALVVAVAALYESGDLG